MRRTLFPKSFINTVPPPERWDRRPVPNLLHRPHNLGEINRLEQWYRELQSGEKSQLKRKLRSLSFREFWSAYFELMTVQVAMSLGATSVRHAPTFHGKHPDLQVVFPSSKKHIWEVTAAFQTLERETDDDKAHALANWLSKEFRHKWTVTVHAEKFPPGGLSVKKAKMVIQNWLDQLENGGPKKLALRPPIIGCNLNLTASNALGREHPGPIVQGLIGQGGNITATDRLREVIRKKVKKYGAVKKENVPLVIFVYEGDWIHISRESLEWALWGQLQVTFSLNSDETSLGVAPGGLFMPGPDGQPQNTRLSAVVYGRRQLHEGKMHAILFVYHHPKAQNPIPNDVFESLPQCHINIGETTFEQQWKNGPEDPIKILPLN